MAGNSLLESVVVGRRVGEAGGGEPEAAASGTVEVSEPGSVDPKIADIMWDNVGPIRDGARLHDAIAALGLLERTGYTELCLMIARAAAARMESRGVHIRSDYGEQDPGFASRSFDQHTTHAPH
jgi:aspartate oxidase